MLGPGSLIQISGLFKTCGGRFSVSDSVSVSDSLSDNSITFFCDCKFARGLVLSLVIDILGGTSTLSPVEETTSLSGGNVFLVLNSAIGLGLLSFP